MAERARSGITVAISTYNRSRFLPEALDSVLSQSLPAERVVVVDDGSTDDTARVLQSFAGRVEVLRLDNGGKARALNTVLPTVTTPFVMFFDDDDGLYPDALARLHETLARSPGAGFAFGGHDLVETDGRLPQGPVAASYRWAQESASMQRLRLFRECTVMMTGALLRTDAVRAVGGLNNALKRCQDYDLMVRLAARSPFAYCGHNVYAWRQHAGARGGAGEAHAAADRLAAWARYNEPIGCFLRDSVALDRYRLDPQHAPDTPAARRQALIARLWCTAPKLPLDVAVQDLRAALALCPDTPLNDQETWMLTEALHHDFVPLRPAAPLLGLLAVLGQPLGTAALAHLSRGLYWIGRREPRTTDRWRWSALALALSAAARAAGALPLGR